jgi:hypothetical protein
MSENLIDSTDPSFLEQIEQEAYNYNANLSDYINQRRMQSQNLVSSSQYYDQFYKKIDELNELNEFYDLENILFSNYENQVKFYFAAKCA